jgi:hypothetical protein
MSKLNIQNIPIETCMGKMRDKLPFLTQKQQDEFNTIGYTGKNSAGEKITRVHYLNSLKKGTFDMTLTKSDNGDFCEEFMLTRVTA